MAITNKQRLEKLINKKTNLQVKLAKLAVIKETYGLTFDGSMHDYYSRKNSDMNRHREGMQGQINNLMRQIETCESKIQVLKSIVYS